MRNPYVQNLWVKDLYIAPIQVIPAEQVMSGNQLQLRKGNNTYFEDYQFNFMGYEINEHELKNEDMQIAAILNVSFAGQQHVLKPAIRVTSQNKKLIPAKLPNAEREIFINKIDIEAESITLLVNNNLNQLQQAEMGKELLAIELTEKPLINILWIGTILMIIGLVISMVNRLSINRL
jgi:cytochrome c-type biogenesis protein CcmF